MSEGIIIALIAAGATILAAFIGLFAKSISKKKTVINQNQKGDNNTQIGIVNNTRSNENE